GLPRRLSPRARPRRRLRVRDGLRLLSRSRRSRPSARRRPLRRRPRARIALRTRRWRDRLGPIAPLRLRGRLHLRASGARPARARPDGRLQVLPSRGSASHPLRLGPLPGLCLPGRAHLSRRPRRLSCRRGSDRVPRPRARPEQDVLAHRRRGDVARSAVALQLGRVPVDALAMDASAYAFTHGVRHTRTPLRTWQDDPGAVLGRWFAGSSLAACGLLVAVLVVSALSTGYVQIVTLGPPFAVGDGGDVLGVLGHNML